MLNVYELTDYNKKKSFFLVLFFTLFIGLIGYLVSYLYGDTFYLLLAFLFASFSNFTSYFFSDRIALSLARAYPADPHQYSSLHSIVDNLSRAAGIPKPKIYLIPTSALNAFATGRNPQNASIAITEGLIQTLNRTELEGVIAHELSHIRHYDTLIMTMVVVLVGMVSILTDWFIRGGLRSRRDEDDRSSNSPLFLLGFILILLAPLIANLIKLAISRRREFYADAQAAFLTRQPSGLIRALQKIASASTIPFASTATAHLYIDSPLPKTSFLAKLFSTHPPVEERIAALQGLKI